MGFFSSLKDSWSAGGHFAQGIKYLNDPLFMLGPAIDSFKKGLEVDPTNAYGIKLLIVSSFANGDLTAGVRLVRTHLDGKGIKDLGTFFDGLTGLTERAKDDLAASWMKNQEKGIKQGIADALALLRQDRKDAFAYDLLGAALLLGGRASEAAVAMLVALRSGVETALVLDNLQQAVASCLEQAEAWKSPSLTKLAAHYAQALTPYAARHRRAAIALALALRCQGNLDGARATISQTLQAMEKTPPATDEERAMHVEACIVLATICNAQGDLKTAALAYQTAFKNAHDFSNREHLQAAAAEINAESALIGKVQSRPTDAAAHFELASHYERIGKFAECIKHFRLAAEHERGGIFSSRAITEKKLAYAKAQRLYGDHGAAIAALSEIVEAENGKDRQQVFDLCVWLIEDLRCYEANVLYDKHIGAEHKHNAKIFKLVSAPARKRVNSLFSA